MHQNSLAPVLVSRERRLQRALAMVGAQSASSVEAIAHAVGLSADHLQRLFKKETGQRLHDLVAESRLLRAAYLLTSTNLAIKEIASAVGYTHVSSFTRAFEHRFGESPNRYRRDKAA